MKGVAVTGGPIDDAAVLNALFGDSPQGLFVFDSEKKVVRYNPAGRGVRKLPAEDVVGHAVEDFTPGFALGELEALVDEAFASDGPLRRWLVKRRRLEPACR